MDQIIQVEQEIAELRHKLLEKENELYLLKRNLNVNDNHCYGDSHPTGDQTAIGVLPKWAIERYSRQILLSEIGVPGQTKICSARVLIVGAGGLGCPAAMYLAGAGVGEIGIVDYDSVEITNIHRQLLHSEQNVNMNKAESAAHAIKSINSRIKVTPYKVQLDSSNALEIASKYDLVLDCTDNAPTRYLLSDMCVMAKLPLISGSALKLEGQLTVYCYRSDSYNGDKEGIYRGPCYRCVFPIPPSPDAMGSCSTHGVAGPVPGVIGTLQAMETIKFIIGHPSRNMLVQRMLIMDVDDMSCKVVQLRPRNPQCAVCSDSPTITRLVDYEAFCKTLAKEKNNDIESWVTPYNSVPLVTMVAAKYPKRRAIKIKCIRDKNRKKDLDVQVLQPINRITAKELSTLLQTDMNTLLMDVRAKFEFDMCNIDGSTNLPIQKLSSKINDLVEKVQEIDGTVVFVCRRGNDSQLAAEMLLNNLAQEDRHKVKDLIGGLHAWAQYVDKNFPVY